MLGAATHIAMIRAGAELHMTTLPAGDIEALNESSVTRRHAVNFGRFTAAVDLDLFPHWTQQ